MRAEHGFTAVDQKSGMSIEELEMAIDQIKRMAPGKKFHVKARIGFGGQMQSIKFVGVENVSATPEGA